MAYGQRSYPTSLQCKGVPGICHEMHCRHRWTLAYKFRAPEFFQARTCSLSAYGETISRWGEIQLQESRSRRLREASESYQ
jgi:hypothetical protein